MTIRVSFLLLVGIASSPASADLPSVPGCIVTEYCTLDAPGVLTFAPDGTLYAGWGGPRLDAKPIYRIDPGGFVSEWGAGSMNDPDAVLYDPAGATSGAAGSVIVGGAVANGPTTAKVWRVLEDETVETLWGPTSTMFQNPTDMAFDSTGRFVMADDFGNSTSGRVVVSNDGMLPTVLFSLGTRLGTLVIDAQDNIITGAFDGVVRKHLPNGQVHPESPLASNMGVFPPLAVGPGARWGSDLHVINRETGQLFRVVMPGQPQEVGSGFTGLAVSMRFGPDGALYVSLAEGDRILRIEPCVAADLDCNGAVDGADLGILLGAWGANESIADLDGDGVVGGSDLGSLLGGWTGERAWLHAWAQRQRSPRSTCIRRRGLCAAARGGHPLAPVFDNVLER